MVTTIFGAITRRGVACLGRVYRSLLRWTKPTTGTLAHGAIGDMTRSKAALVAENALLRQQLIVLRRQVKRPTRAARDRVLLVLLARTSRRWRDALLIVGVRQRFLRRTAI